jgi:hypothetical protein
LSLSNANTVPIQFSDPQDLRCFVESNGLYFHNGTKSPGLFSINCYIADHPLTFDTLPALATARQGDLSEAWRGTLRITWPPGPSWADDLSPDCVDVTSRVWGGLVAFGNEGLLNRFEDLYRREKRAAAN